MIKLWIDDIRIPPSQEWIWIQGVNKAKEYFLTLSSANNADILISLDHDAGDYTKDGGDYINILNWLEESGLVDTGYSFRLHSMNPVGVQNMRAIIQKNNWKEIK